MKQVRRIHLYLGCFITPLLLLYLVSGFYFIAFPERQKDEGEAQSMMQKMWWMHTDQQWPRGVSDEIDPMAKPEDQPKTITTYEANTTLFKYLVYGMVIFAVATMILGLVLAVKTTKDKQPVIISLAIGVLLPAVLLFAGQNEVEKPNPFHPDNAEMSFPGPSGLTPDGPGLAPPGEDISPLPGIGPGTPEGEPSILPPGSAEN